MGQRGRKQGANGEERRARLLSIAADEFAANGYFATKVSQIVKKAGVTQPTFYLYFESKEAIFQELITSFRDKLSTLTKNSKLETGLDHHSLPERIAVGLTAILQFFSENQNLTKIGFFMSEESEEIKNQIAELITENLISEQRDGYFRSDMDMRTVAESLVGIIERLTITYLFQGKKQPNELAKEIINLLLYGLQTK